MTPQDFDEILGLAYNDITKINTNTRDKIQINIKLGNSSFSRSSIHKVSAGKITSIHSCFCKCGRICLSSREIIFECDIHHLKNSKLEHLPFHNFSSKFIICLVYTFTF